MDWSQRVIIVDDNPLDANHMRWLIRDAGCEAEVAADGQEGWEIIRQQPPALVVTDLMMPIMNGLELTQRVADEFPRLPVILATGVGNEDVAAEALHRGATSYVPKHLLSKTFVPTVRRIIRRIHSQGMLRQFAPCLKRAELQMELPNDDSQVPHLVASLVEHVRSYGCYNERELMHLGTALDECLLNAILHGNLEIASDLRELGRGRIYRQTIRQRQQQTPFMQRKVYVRLQVSQEEVRFVIRDEGPGFDPAVVPDPLDPANLTEASGRGLLLIRTFMDQVFHNEEGNEITMVKCRRSADPATASLG